MILLLRICISQSFYGDFFDSIDPERKMTLTKSYWRKLSLL